MVARQLALPHAYGRYELLARLGSGGMASVYLARARGPGGFQREVAIKITHPHLSEQSEFVAGLLQEARIAARIRHPNVVPVLDVGEEEDGAFLVMDYVEGEVLSLLARHAREDGGRIPLPIALRILSDALAGLHAAHELRDDHGELLGIVHRDFSPQNILVGIDGMARLTDFGIARVASTSSSTKSGFIKGKLGYLSPEQVRAPRNVDRRADVWSAGVVAWELATGQALFDRDDEATTLLRIVSEEPPRVRSIRSDVPEAVDEAIARALEMDPAERLATADELRRLLVDRSKTDVPLAEPGEVAAYVARAAGEKLRERRNAFAVAASEPETRAELASVARAAEVASTGAGMRWALAALALGVAGAGTVFVMSAPRRVTASVSERASVPSASASASASEAGAASASASGSEAVSASASASAPAPEPSAPRQVTPHNAHPVRKAPARSTGRPALPVDPLGNDAR